MNLKIDKKSYQEHESKPVKCASEKPTISKKPASPGKPTKPTISSKPQVASKPATLAKSDPDRIPKKENVFQKEEEKLVADDLGQDDILKYLQAQSETANEEVDLFS